MQIQGAKAQKWGCCTASREFLGRSMRAHIAFQMPQSCLQHSCELIGTGRGCLPSTSAPLQAGCSSSCPNPSDWAELLVFLKNTGMAGYQLQPWTEEGDTHMEIRFPRKAPGFLTAAERSNLYFCGKCWCLSWELPIHSGCLGSSKNLGSSVPREFLGLQVVVSLICSSNGQKQKKWETWLRV